MFIEFKERAGRGRKERGREREISISCLPYMPRQGMEPKT